MRKILVVDDDPDVLLGLKNVLSRNNYKVSATRTCSEGLNVLAEFKPDLVLLDINVGDEDGREMCKKIKELAEFKHIPVILFSADHDAVKNFAVHNADSAIEKPFEISKMLHLIKEQLDTPPHS